MDDEPWESIPWDFDDYLEDSDAPWMIQWADMDTLPETNIQ